MSERSRSDRRRDGATTQRWNLLVLLLVAALTAIGVAAGDADSARQALWRVAVIGAGLAAAAWMLRRSASATSSSPELFEEVLRTAPADRTELPGFRAIDTAVRMAVANAFGVETMLKPRVRELAAWRLRRDRGIDLGEEPERARAAVGDALWRLIDTSATRPSNNAPGIKLTDLTAAVEQLELL